MNPGQSFETQSPVNPALLPDVASRNCHLFGVVRHQAYRQIRLRPEHDEFSEWTLEQCCRQNCAYMPQLRHPEVRSVARSIARWVWAHRHKLCAHRRGVMNLPLIVTSGQQRRLEARERKRQGAAYSRTKRTAAVDDKIRPVIEQRKREGRPITERSIAKLAERRPQFGQAVSAGWGGRFCCAFRE